MKKKSYGKAIDAYKRMIKIDSTRAELYSSLGYAYGKKGDTDKAIANYKISLSYDREDDMV